MSILTRFVAAPFRLFAKNKRDANVTMRKRSNVNLLHISLTRPYKEWHGRLLLPQLPVPSGNCINVNRNLPEVTRNWYPPILPFCVSSCYSQYGEPLRSQKKTKATTSRSNKFPSPLSLRNCPTQWGVLRSVDLCHLFEIERFSLMLTYSNQFEGLEISVIVVRVLDN